jgi:chemotaxis protein MotB
MPEMDTSDNDKDTSLEADDSQAPAQTEAVNTRISPWALSPAQAADPFRGVGLGIDLSNHDDDNLWSIPWANLMMVLFAIVFMLISLQSKEYNEAATDSLATDQQVAGQSANTITVKNTAPIYTGSQQSTTSASPQQRDRESVNSTVILAQIENAIATSKGDRVSTTVTDDRSIKLSLAVDMLFKADTTELTQQARIILQQLSVPLRDIQHHIHIIGHTDDQNVDAGLYADNWALSLAHASAVTRHLIESGKIEADRFTIMGRAQYDPLTSNLIASSRAINRRVDIIITLDVYPPAEKKL